MSEALARVSPELVAELQRLEEPVLRSAILVACTMACQVTALDDIRVRQALDALKRGRTGEIVARYAVRTLTEELDVIAWDIQDHVEAGDAGATEYQVAFRRARAAASVDEAFGSATLRAAYETFYEASFAVDDLDLLMTAVTSR
jgi:hypothetical protein